MDTGNSLSVYKSLSWNPFMSHLNQSLISLPVSLRLDLVLLILCTNKYLTNIFHSYSPINIFNYFISPTPACTNLLIESLWSMVIKLNFISKIIDFFGIAHCLFFINVSETGLCLRPQVKARRSPVSETLFEKKTGQWTMSKKLIVLLICNRHKLLDLNFITFIFNGSLH
jgi:hypothetical protein